MMRKTKVGSFTRRHPQHGLLWSYGLAATLSGYGSPVSQGQLTVDLHLAVRDNGADLAPLLEVGEALAGEGAVDLEPVDKGGDGDKTVGLNVLVELVRGGLVEDDGVLGLVLDCVRA